MTSTKIPREASDLPLAVQAQLAALGAVGELDQDDLRSVAVALASVLRGEGLPQPRRLS